MSTSSEPTAATTAAQEPIVRLANVSKSFGATHAIDSIDLSIYPGEFFALLGASGCGKSTLLRMLAGLELPSSGRIYIDGVDVSAQPSYRRPLNMMFQSYALFPHMSVADNIAFGLKQEGMPAPQRKQRVQEMMELLHIADFAKRKPTQLSGGQQQRVALARSLAKQPKILLLDEPLGALDKKLREATQFELVNIQERLGMTFIMVTHDQEEAMTMASRIALLRSGRIEQLDSPRRMYEFPATRYAANFIGAINLLDGQVVAQTNDIVDVQSDDAGGLIKVRHSQPMSIGQTVTVALRPEKCRMIPQRSDEANEVSGVVKEIAYLGDVSVYHLDLPSGKRMQFTESNYQALAEQPVTWGQQIHLNWSASSAGLLTE